MKPKQTIILQIKSLLAKTTTSDCTEAEALSAAEKIGELLRKYDLTLSEVEFVAEEFTTGRFSTKSSIQGPLHNLISGISKFTDTKVWFNRRETIEYSFYGTENDVRVAEFMCDLLLRSITKEIELFKKSISYKKEVQFIAGKTLTTSFKNGIVYRLSKRLIELKDLSKQKTVSETGLVPLDKLVVVNKKFAELGMRLKTEKSRTTVKSNSAYMSGVIAGDKVNITVGKQISKNMLKLN